MNRIVILMYHALYKNEREFIDIDLADRPYAVSVDTFEQHLDMLSNAGIPVINPKYLQEGITSNTGVVLTFDDGHGSNFHHAMPALAKRGLNAVFFITTNFIGNRNGFCDWPQVREMSDSGMVIGSHGCTHKFFDDMKDQEARLEFDLSKRVIEQEISQLVDQISFPGGRYTQNQILIGEQAGYQLFHSSRIGNHSLAQLADKHVLCRIAMRNTTSDDAFISFARADPGFLFRAQLVAESKQFARRIMGNRLYHAVYEKLASRN